MNPCSLSHFDSCNILVFTHMSVILQDLAFSFTLHIYKLTQSTNCGDMFAQEKLDKSVITNPNSCWDVNAMGETVLSSVFLVHYFYMERWFCRGLWHQTQLDSIDSYIRWSKSFLLIAKQKSRKDESRMEFYFTSDRVLVHFWSPTGNLDCPGTSGKWFC